MPSTIKTPGVYIKEQHAQVNVVGRVPTAVPVFIGFTEQISYTGKSLVNKPIKISSSVEFLSIFGAEAPKVRFSLNSIRSEKNSSDANFTSNGLAYELNKETIHYRMYSGLKFFFQNGGRDCYVLSVGAYDYSKSYIDDIQPFLMAMQLLETEIKPTILVIPDVVEMKAEDAYALQSKMIDHCGTLMDRVAILDIPDGYYEIPGEATSVEKFRNNVEPSDAKFNSYATAYYPWLHTTIYKESEISYENIGSHDGKYTELRKLISNEFTDKSGVVNTELTGITENLIAEMIKSKPSKKDAFTFDGLLKTMSKSYGELVNAILTEMNLLAPSPAIAGIYTMVDNSAGVWKAPAGISVQSTIAPSIKIDAEMQKDLNVPVNGKSVCAIRSFPGIGIQVWGARTLDGNSNDWRYINVRRTLIYIEQSAIEATKAFSFEPNDANTWVRVSTMIANFLTDIWKEGGLAGTKPSDAFSVGIGLGVTMTADDILKGIMRVSIKVAISHPAEFIIFTWQQKMQVT